MPIEYVRSLLSTLALMPNVLQMKRALETILGLDWLDRLELMILIEDAFAEVEISENDVTQIDVVGDLMRILTS